LCLTPIAVHHARNSRREVDGDERVGELVQWERNRRRSARSGTRST
jgi:hypothetical protein